MSNYFLVGQQLIGIYQFITSFEYQCNQPAMLTENHYLSLYKSKIKPNDLNQTILEIAQMHNALGQAIKQMASYLDLTKNNKPNTSMEQEKQSDVHSINPQRNPKNKRYQQKRLIIKKQTKKQQIENIEQSSSQQAVSTSLDAIKNKIQPRNTKFKQIQKINSSIPANSNMNPNPKNNKMVTYRQNQRNNENKSELLRVECQQCRDFYEAAGMNQESKDLCEHTSRHKTTAPYQKIKNFSQEFDNDF